MLCFLFTAPSHPLAADRNHVSLLQVERNLLQKQRSQHLELLSSILMHTHVYVELAGYTISVSHVPTYVRYILTKGINAMKICMIKWLMSRSIMTSVRKKLVTELWSVA